MESNGTRFRVTVTSPASVTDSPCRVTFLVSGADLVDTGDASSSITAIDCPCEDLKDDDPSGDFCTN